MNWQKFKHNWDKFLIKYDVQVGLFIVFSALAIACCTMVGVIL